MNIKFKGYLNNVLKINNQFAKQHMKKYDEKRKEQFDRKQIDKIYKIGDLVEFIKGPININGNEVYNPHRWSGIYKVVKVQPSKLNYNLENINDSNDVVKNINIKKIIPYVEQNIDYKTEEYDCDRDDEKEIEFDATKEKLSMVAQASN
jgi:hypothetical protein